MRQVESRRTVMNKNLYDKRLSWNSAEFEEHIIPDANHAQYGDYGEQLRDNATTITADEQTGTDGGDHPRLAQSPRSKRRQQWARNQK